MNHINKDNNSNLNFRIGEFILGFLALTYFLIYPRDTLSDFIILTSLSLLLIFFGARIGLSKPSVAEISKSDFLLLLFSLGLFFSAWIYGFSESKLNVDNGLKSLGITLVYFYYAWIQHFLAQRYLALRLLHFNEKLHTKPPFGVSIELIAALLTGLVFGILHIPYPLLMLPAAFGGFIYAYYFLTTGRLWAVVSSHALVSSAGIFWILDENPFTELIVLF
jgi:membrane protease YdiL (CAAX protease family)